MSNVWVKRSESILEQIKLMEATEGKDRLALVHTMRFGLGALWESITGWMRWINNPQVMTKFTQEELAEMNKTVIDFVKDFIEYDIKITKQGVQKGLNERSSTDGSSSQERFYV